MKDYKIYRDENGNLTLEGYHNGVVFIVTAKTEDLAKEALLQLQRFESREGTQIEKV